MCPDLQLSGKMDLGLEKKTKKKTEQFSVEIFL